MASDDEGFRFEGGIFNTEAGLPFGAPFINISTGRDPPPVFLSRRNRSGEAQSCLVYRAHSQTDSEDFQVFGRARNAPPPPPETTTHPLLLDASNQSNRFTSNVRRGARHSHRNIAIGADLFQSLDDIMGPGSTQFLQQILTAGGAHAFQLDMGNGVNLDRLHRRPNQGVISAAIRVERGPRASSPKQGREFEPILTLQRWEEEAKILNGEFVSERSGKLVNHVILALLPAAAEAKKRANEAEKKETEETAANDVEEEDKARQDTEPEPEQQAESLEQPTEIPLPAVVPEETGPVEQVTEAPTEGAPGHDQTMEVVTADQDTPMTDATVQETHEGVEGEPSHDAEVPVPQQRITVTIHGSQVDITDTGIDPTFLEALPDDMREEVLNQHVRDQRAATVERPADSQISAEFLDALPPEIRAEIIQQEAMERARLRADESATTQPAHATEIDPASFIASLDPTLRQTVLMEQNEGFLQALPSHVLAEAGNLAGGARRPSQRNPPRVFGASVPPPRKFAVDHDAIQLLDKSGIAALVRLLFFPQVSKKSLLFKVLVNICENTKTRAELFNVLLSILQDGPGDLAAVDKSFSQLTVRNTSKPQTPKSVGKQKATSDYLAALTSTNARIDAVPDLVVQRCLESLTYIVSANELASLFFLTEHELPAGLRKSSSRKGKGKEKQIPQTHYPIVLLLSLLDRQPLIRTPAIMESLVGLLATVTRPLASLKPKEDDKSQPVGEAISQPQNPLSQLPVVQGESQGNTSIPTGE
jgi:E3 ubiquitin-protein ligase HUWE1